jgi:carbon monoxide dehydrogenase subunit G
MKLIKLGLISVVIIFGIITAMGLLLPAESRISRTVEIQKPSDKILPFVNSLFGWQKWINGLDSKKIESATATSIGKSSMHIYSTTKNEVMGSWVDEKGKINKYTLQIIDQGNTTIVNWQFENKASWFPLDRLGSIVNEKVTGKMMEDNLANLKKIVEENP